MKKLLRKRGIKINRRARYEFPSAPIPWFSTEHPTNIEVEVIRRRDLHEVVVSLCLDASCIVVSEPYMVCSIVGGRTPSDMLVAQPLKDNLCPHMELPFDEVRKAYVVSDVLQFDRLLLKLLELTCGRKAFRLRFL